MRTPIGAQVRKTALAALAALALATSPEIGKAADPDSTVAHQRYVTGAQAYAAGRYADAVEQFMAADRISPSSALSFDIARAYEKLGESSLALRWFRDYLHRAGDPPDAAKVHRIVQGLEQKLKDKGVQQVTVRSVPHGATVTIDGDPAGVTPWTNDLAPGHHRLIVVYEGYERSERGFVLPPDHAIDIDVRLARTEPGAAGISAPSAAAAGRTDSPPSAATAKESTSAQSAVPSAAIAPVSQPEPKRSSGAARTVGIVTMGVGGLTLGGALAYELLRQEAQNDAKKDPTQYGYAKKIEQANDRQTTARVLLGVGAGLVVAGGVLFIVGGPSSEHRTEVALGCGPGRCGATASGRF
jgi:hypothetical protein